jgi:hypothetical protein
MNKTGNGTPLDSGARPFSRRGFAAFSAKQLSTEERLKIGSKLERILATSTDCGEDFATWTGCVG